MNLWQTMKSWFGAGKSHESDQTKGLSGRGPTSMILQALMHNGFKIRSNLEVLQTYEQNPDIRKVIDMIGMTTATSKMQVMRNGEEDNIHPLNAILNRPNRFMSRKQLVSMMTKYIDLVGECYLVRRDTIRGPELYVVPPHKVHFYPKRPFHAEIILWGQEDDPNPEILESAMIGEDFVRIMRHSLLHPYTESLGWGETLGAELDISEFAATHEATWLKNHGAKDILLNAPGLKAEQRKQLREAWARQSGPEHSGKPFLLNLKEVEAIDIQNDFDSEGLIEQRKYSAAVVREAFGVPREVMGDNITSNRATSKVADFQFKKNVCQPRADFIAEQLDQHAIHILKDHVDVEGITIEAENIVPKDKEFIKEIVQIAPQSFTVNEVRELADKGPIKGGDVLLDDVDGPGDPVELVFEDNKPEQHPRMVSPLAINGSLNEKIDVLAAAKELSRS